MNSPRVTLAKNSGLSLVEILVAVALSGFAVMAISKGLSQFNSVSMKTAAKSQAGAEMGAIVRWFDTHAPRIATDYEWCQSLGKAGAYSDGIRLYTRNPGVTACMADTPYAQCNNQSIFQFFQYDEAGVGTEFMMVTQCYNAQSGRSEASKLGGAGSDCTQLCPTGTVPGITLYKHNPVYTYDCTAQAADYWVLSQAYPANLVNGTGRAKDGEIIGASACVSHTGFPENTLDIDISVEYYVGNGSKAGTKSIDVSSTTRHFLLDRKAMQANRYILFGMATKGTADNYTLPRDGFDFLQKGGFGYIYNRDQFCALRDPVTNSNPINVYVKGTDFYTTTVPGSLPAGYTPVMSNLGYLYDPVSPPTGTIPVYRLTNGVDYTFAANPTAGDLVANFSYTVQATEGYAYPPEYCR